MHLSDLTQTQLPECDPTLPLQLTRWPVPGLSIGNTTINNIICGRSVIYLGYCTYYHTARLLSPLSPHLLGPNPRRRSLPASRYYPHKRVAIAPKFHLAVFMQLLPALHSASASICTKKSAQHSEQGIAAITQAPLPLILARRRMMHR
jgi:hypothetical protein